MEAGTAAGSGRGDCARGRRRPLATMSRRTAATTTTMTTVGSTLSMSHLLRGEEGAVEDGWAPVVQRSNDSTGQLAPEVRGVDALAVQVLRAEHRRDRGVVEREVGRASHGERRR